MKYKKFLLIIITIILVIILNSIAPKTTIKDRLISIGIGIDIEQDNIQVTIVSLKGDKGYVNVSSYGKNIEEALENINKKTGKTPSLSNSLIVVCSYGDENIRYLNELFIELVKNNIVDPNVFIVRCGNSKEFLSKDAETSDSIVDQEYLKQKNSKKGLTLVEYLSALYSDVYNDIPFIK